MAEMLVVTPTPTKTLTYYDITFESGTGMALTLDTAAGDAITFDDHAILVKLTSKPSMNDPTKTLPAEDITIFPKHIVAIQKRVREVPQLTPEQSFEWNKTFQELQSKAIH